MQLLLAQAPSLQLFTPVLIAAGIALFLVVLGRRIASRNCAVAVRASDRWAPPIPTAQDFPLNRVDPHPHPVQREPSEIPLDLSAVEFLGDVAPFDSASMTLRFRRV